jgi:hypothetical protein
MVEPPVTRIHAVHLRSVQHTAEGVFYEANHLEGSMDMPAVVRALLTEQAARRQHRHGARDLRHGQLEQGGGPRVDREVDDGRLGVGEGHPREQPRQGQQQRVAVEHARLRAPAPWGGRGSQRKKMRASMASPVAGAAAKTS